MRVAKVIGTVTLSTAHESLRGGSYRIVVPQSLSNLRGGDGTEAEELIAYDEYGSGMQSFIALSEGGEAAQPFKPNYKPVDAYCAAILDQIVVD
jgi:ethanolamine utilization protein EutN